MQMPLRKPTRGLVTFAVFATVVAAALPAAAAVSPAPTVPGPAPVVSTAATVSAVNSSMWQTNNYVWALGYSGGKLFAGGDFTYLRAPGVPPPDTSYPVGYVAAFNTSAGPPAT